MPQDSITVSQVMDNKIQHLPTYNSRLQMSGFSDLVNGTVSTATTLLNASLNWGTTANNGNLMGASYSNGGPTYSQPLMFSQTFTYDGVNRLTGATDSGGWSRTLSYDAYGNMTPAGTPAPPTESFNGNNQIVGQSYDQIGNLLSANGNTLAYDFDNHVQYETDGVSKAVETYFYDGDGNRAQKTGPNGSPVIHYVYDALGRMAAEYSSTTERPGCVTCYLSLDHLGSTRVVTDQNGLVVGRHDYLPFGEEVAASQFGRDGHWGGGTDFLNRKFTGKERDSESGLEYFGARYYGSALGRFTSPDEFKGGFDNLNGTPAFSPGPIGYADLTDPQTLNMYVYTRNNPLRYIDPDGHDFWDYLSGVGNAFVSDNALGAGRSSGGNQDFRLGQVVGDAVATVTGSIEALGGGGEAVVTSPAALTGVGALVPAAGAAVAAHGATTAAIAGGHLVAAAASKVDDIAGQIEQGGYQVTQNPKTPNQEGNVTISHPDQPGTRVNVRVETHPISGSGGKPVRHANVEVVKPGPKNRPRVESNEHIDQ